MALNYFRIVFGIVAVVLFYYSFPSADALLLAFSLVAGYFLSGIVWQWLKKLFFKPILLFDLHNVMIAGDWEVEDMYELPGTRQLIRRLRSRYFVAALTNMAPELWKLQNNKFNFVGEFDAVYYSGKYGIRKPEKKIFEIVFRDLSVSPREIIFLDDREENVAAARKLGMAGIVFQSASQAERALNSMGIKTR